MRLKDYSYVQGLGGDYTPNTLNEIDGCWIIPFCPLKGKEVYSIRSHLTPPLLEIWDLVEEDTEELLGQALVPAKGAQLIVTDTCLTVWNEEHKKASLNEEFWIFEHTDDLLVCAFESQTHYILIGEEDED